FLRNRFYFSSRRRHTRFSRDWSSDVCSSDLKSISAEPSSADRSATSGTCLALYGAGLLIASVDDDELPARRLAAHVILHHEVVRSEERRVGKDIRKPKGMEHSN